MNGTKLYPLGKIPVHLQLDCHEYDDELHIYPNISGALLSWKACKGLGIPLDNYPYPITRQRVNQLINLNPNNTTPTSLPFIFDNILKEFPSVFDRQIRTMTGEEFNIHLSQDAKPFCVNFASTHHAQYHLRIVTNSRQNWSCYSNRTLQHQSRRLWSGVPP